MRHRLLWLLPLCSALCVLLLSGRHLSGQWRRVLHSRMLTGTRMRQLNAVADNLSRILMATETESALLNRDVNRFLKIVEKQITELKAEKERSPLK